MNERKKRKGNLQILMHGVGAGVVGAGVGAAVGGVGL
jgi:hypothetical protein